MPGYGRTPHHQRLHTQRIVFTDQQIQQAIAFVADTGILAELQPLIDHPIGRPRLLTLQGLLVGMTLCASVHSGRILLDQVTDILHWAIPTSRRAQFAVPDRPDTAAGFEAGYAVIRRLFHNLIKVMDPSPLPKNKRLDKTKAAALSRQADTAALQDKRAQLVKVTNAILEASLASARPHLDKHWDGSIGLDATPIATWSHGVKTSGPVTATDPDAGWYVRDGDHTDPDTHPTGSNGGTKPKGRKKKHSRKAKYLFGYDATLAVARNPAITGTPTTDGRGDPKAVPALVLGMILDKPGHRPGPNAITVLADIAARGHRPGYLAADRLYNNSDPDTFQLPARTLGYQPVYDYRADQLGIQSHAHGALLIDGGWHCPATPRPLIDTGKDLDTEKIDGQTWQTRIAARQAFRLVPKGAPDREGHQRLSCPAAAGKVQCPLKASSMGTNPRLPLVQPEPSPVDPPKICRQGSITMAPEHGAQHWQPLAHGTPEWDQVYHRLRNSVEGVNGYAKDINHEALERSGTRRIRGIAAQSLLAAFQLAHANQRKITRWLDTLPDETGQARRRPTRRRTTRPLGTWTPAGHLPDQRQPIPA